MQKEPSRDSHVGRLTDFHIQSLLHPNSSALERLRATGGLFRNNCLNAASARNQQRSITDFRLDDLQ